MQLSETYRGLDDVQTESAKQQIRLGTNRLRRLLMHNTQLRAVVDGDAQYRVTLALNDAGEDYTSLGESYELHEAIVMAFERMRVQMVRYRDKQASQRYPRAA